MNRFLARGSRFEIVPFDRRAATECALQLAAHWSARDRKKITKTKFKYDWMILSCALSRNVKTLYASDQDLIASGTQAGMKVIALAHLPNPDGPQQSLSFDDA